MSFCIYMNDLILTNTDCFLYKLYINNYIYTSIYFYSINLKQFLINLIESNNIYYYYSPGEYYVYLFDSGKSFRKVAQSCLSVSH